MLIDSIPFGRLRGRLGGYAWLLFAVAGVGLRHEVTFESFAMFATGFMLCGLLGWFVGAFVIGSAGCPECGHRILWEHYNADYVPHTHPFELKSCPACGFEPTS